MQLNHYDPNSRIYTHSAAAVPNPKRPGEFFHQAFAVVDLVPALQVNQVAIRNEENTEWLVVEDNRGSIWNTETKQQAQLSGLGPVPDGYTVNQPGQFDGWVDGQWQKDESAELDDAKAKAVQVVKQYATECRAKLVDGLDRYRMAEYSDKAALGPLLVAGTASEEDRADALADPWAVENGITDAAVVGAEWVKQAHLLRQMRNKVNQMERDALKEIQSRRAVHTVQEKLDEWQQLAEQQMAELLAS